MADQDPAALAREVLNYPAPPEKVKLARAVLALTEERDALRAALSELYATRSVAADIEDGMNVVRCTDAEWDAHVAACRKARAALRGKEGT